jgi:hypothetical protein
MRVLAAAGDIGATIATIRLVTPLQELAARGDHELRLRSFHDTAAHDLEWADVLVLQRATTSRAWQLVERMGASGGAVVHEIDDLLTQMPPQLLQYAAVTRGLPWLRRTLRAADLTTVSTARLGAALAGEVQRWTEVPNYALPQPMLPPRDVAATPILCFASSDRVPVEAVAKTLHRSDWRVLAVGPVAEDLQRCGVEVELRPLMPRNDFLAMLRGLPNPVGVIPLADTPFDACKSAIKWFDFALAGVPSICVDRPPYSDVIRDGETGWLVADETAAWQHAFARLHCEPAALAVMAQRAAEEVQRLYSLTRTTDAWEHALASIEPKQRRPALGLLSRWFDDFAIGLRQANRARLARRLQR